jgi:K+/H+ antiporter YhaU regulatory subunit KhtT
MEALELAGAYDEVITYCEKFLEFLESKEEESELVNRYYATILEKMAIQYMKKEEPEQALPLLKNAQVRIGKGRQPITDEFLNWLQRGYKINKKQINETQIKNNYYIVRQNKVIPEIAVELPKAISPF